MFARCWITDLGEEGRLRHASSAACLVDPEFGSPGMDEGSPYMDPLTHAGDPGILAMR